MYYYKFKLFLILLVVLIHAAKQTVVMAMLMNTINQINSLLIIWLISRQKRYIIKCVFMTLIII